MEVDIRHLRRRRIEYQVFFEDRSYLIVRSCGKKEAKEKAKNAALCFRCFPNKEPTFARIYPKKDIGK
jgi:hypothetical protein